MMKFVETIVKKFGEGNFPYGKVFLKTKFVTKSMNSVRGGEILFGDNGGYMSPTPLFLIKDVEIQRKISGRVIVFHIWVPD